MTDETPTNDAAGTTDVTRSDRTRATLTAFLQRLGTGDVLGLVELFADDASWEVPGDAANVPWLGRRTPDLIPGFFSSMALTVREAFDIERTLVDGSDAVLIGHARLSFIPASTTIETPFAIRHSHHSRRRRQDQQFLHVRGQLVSRARRTTGAQWGADTPATGRGERAKLIPVGA